MKNLLFIIFFSYCNYSFAQVIDPRSMVQPTGSVGAPTITLSVLSLNNFTNTTGNASTSQSFTASGTGLTTNISVSAPSGFEISTDNISFNTSLTLTQSGGAVGTTFIYVRVSQF